MATITVSKEELKEIVEDLVEDRVLSLLESNEKLGEIIEDLAFGRLMEEAKDSPVIEKDKFMKDLKKRITGK